MKAMDEFGSVVSMAALILGICAAADIVFDAPQGARGGSASVAPGRAAPQFAPAARHAAFEIAGNAPIAPCVRQRTDGAMNPSDDGCNDRPAASRGISPEAQGNGSVQIDRQ